ncbi:hypothetical protein, partial [Salmonella sp. s51090]|uniref:hypothetical protein n=1 Tax=Salmonella sp. s51090 TaxID=3159651 RepID=UPI003980816E
RLQVKSAYPIDDYQDSWRIIISKGIKKKLQLTTPQKLFRRVCFYFESFYNLEAHRIVEEITLRIVVLVLILVNVTQENPF